jgi:hypothetical protein
MKYVIAFLFFASLIVSCKSETSDSSNLPENKNLTIAQKIANAHGYNKWKDVSEVRFTFKVDRDSVKGKGRQWIWQPKSDSVTLTMEDQVVKYSRRTMDSTHIAPDRAFINDKFWMFVPFQLVWDEVAQITEPKKSTAPISEKELNMITLSYPDDAGGYTPGDAYYIYYDEDYIIREWTFRKGNSPEPTLSTTFENYKDFNGIKIAIDHKMAKGNWNLNFTDVSVSFD